MGRSVEAKRLSRRIQKQKKRKSKKLSKHSKECLISLVPRPTSSQNESPSATLLTKHAAYCNDFASLQQKKELDTVSCVSECSSNYASGFSSFGSPGSPPPTPTSESDIETGKEIVETSHSCMHQCSPLQDKLHDVTERMQLYYKKVQEQETRIEDLQANTQTRVNSVRNFWKNKIYLEGSRFGKIVKMSMQKYS